MIRTYVPNLLCTRPGWRKIVGLALWHAGLPWKKKKILCHSKIFHITRPHAHTPTRPYAPPRAADLGDHLHHAHPPCNGLPCPLSVCCACAKSDEEWRLFCTSKASPVGGCAGAMPCGLALPAGCGSLAFDRQLPRIQMLLLPISSSSLTAPGEHITFPTYASIRYPRPFTSRCPHKPIPHF